jgi:hypothetical protein
MKREDLNPAAIVREADTYHDCLVAARGLGDRVNRDLAAQTEWLIKAKKLCPHGEWEGALKRLGFIPRTVQWQIKKYQEAQKRNIALLGHLLSDRVTDEPEPDSGQSDTTPSSRPVHVTAQRELCRPCQAYGPKPGCKACKAVQDAKVNLFKPEEPAAPVEVLPPREEPAPTADAAEDVKPDVLVDVDGLILPESARAAMECTAIETFIQQHLDPVTEAFDSLKGKPGTIHTNLKALRHKAKALAGMLRSSKPAHRCKHCNGNRCDVCKIGVVSKAIWSEEKKRAWFKAQREKQERSRRPLED